MRIETQVEAKRHSYRLVSTEPILTSAPAGGVCPTSNLYTYLIPTSNIQFVAISNHEFSDKLKLHTADIIHPRLFASLRNLVPAMDIPIGHRIYYAEYICSQEILKTGILIVVWQIAYYPYLKHLLTIQFITTPCLYCLVIF